MLMEEAIQRFISNKLSKIEKQFKQIININLWKCWVSVSLSKLLIYCFGVCVSITMITFFIHCKLIQIKVYSKPTHSNLFMKINVILNFIRYLWIVINHSNCWLLIIIYDNIWTTKLWITMHWEMLDKR
jgi:ribosome-associated translation inhibitor RaiA